MEWIKQNWLIIVAVQQAGVLVFTSQNDLVNKFIYQEQDKQVLVNIQEEIEQGTEIYLFENVSNDEVRMFFQGDIEEIKEENNKTYIKFKQSEFVYMFSHKKELVEKLLNKQLLEIYQKDNIVFVKITGGVNNE